MDANALAAKLQRIEAELATRAGSEPGRRLAERLAEEYEQLAGRGRTRQELADRRQGQGRLF